MRGYKTEAWQLLRQYKVVEIERVVDGERSWKGSLVSETIRCEG